MCLEIHWLETTNLSLPLTVLLIFFEKIMFNLILLPNLKLICWDNFFNKLLFLSSFVTIYKSAIPGLFWTNWASETSSDKLKNAYKYQGLIDVNKNGINEAIFTNKVSGRSVTASVDSFTGTIDFSKYGEGGTTSVVGSYIDPLVNCGEVEQFGPHKPT